MRVTFAAPLAVVLAALPVWAEGVSDAMARRIIRAPDRFIENAMMLVHGFGDGIGVTAAGVENYVALQRAEGRALALRRLLAADLDGDGTVAADENAVAVAAAGATARGRLMAAQALADADGDGDATAAEVAAYAQSEAEQSFSEGRAQAVRVILGFDGDADGRVTLDEVRQAVAALLAAAAVPETGRRLTDDGPGPTAI